MRGTAAAGRAVIPAVWFYEWDRSKQKHTFYREGGDPLFIFTIEGM